MLTHDNAVVAIVSALGRHDTDEQDESTRGSSSETVYDAIDVYFYFAVA